MSNGVSNFEYWRQAGRPDARTGESTSEYIVRNFDDEGLIERMFLFDSVGWSTLSNKLTPEPSLPYRPQDIRIKPRDRFKFAALEGGLDVDSSNCPLNFNRELGVTSADQADAVVWARHLLKQIKTAVDKGADVICAGEFAYPPLDLELETGESLRDEIQKLVENAERPVFIVPGSRHFRSDGHDTGASHYENVSLIFGGDSSAGDNLQTRAEKLPFQYRKRSPSVGLGERLISPKDTKIPVFITPFSNISVLICSDAFDPRILFSFLRENENPNKAQLILVPSYNTSPLFDESCMYLSYLANSTVVCVNSKMSVFPEDCVRFFVAGVERESFGKLVWRSRETMKLQDQNEADLIRNCINLKEVDVVEADEISPRSGVKERRNIAFYDIDVVNTGNLAKRASERAGILLKTARAACEKFKM